MEDGKVVWEGLSSGVGAEGSGWEGELMWDRDKDF
jgi:hypothetical protein